MNCIKCRLRGWYYTLLKWLMLPVRTSKDGIRFTSQVIATLYKDGKIIRRIVGPNKWQSGGLDDFASALYTGSSGTDPNKVIAMRLGSQCSDTAFTYITGTDETTTNSKPASEQAKFTAQWAAAGAINNICQACVRKKTNVGGGPIDGALYNFVTQFDKPDGVSLKIEWTTTVTSS